VVILDETELETGGLTGLPTVHRAYRWESEDGAARCGVCHQNCLVGEGDWGFCGVKVNLGGELHTVVYGDILLCESRPVEMKPFFHFHPGRSLMTICGPSCNMRCPWCRNHRLSQVKPRPLKAGQVPMMEIVRAAEESGDVGLCVSVTEPTLMLEYCMGLFREAGARKLDCTFVSNGYFTSDALHMLARSGMNALSVDIKGSADVYRDYCQAPGGDIPAWTTVKDSLTGSLLKKYAASTWSTPGPTFRSTSPPTGPPSSTTSPRPPWSSWSGRTARPRKPASFSRTWATFPAIASRTLTVRGAACSCWSARGSRWSATSPITGAARPAGTPSR